NDFVYNDMDSGAKVVGECIALPNDYVKICLNSLTVSEDDYATYTFEFDTSVGLDDTFLTNTSVPGLHLSTSATEGFELRAYTASNNVSANETATKKAKDVWLYTPGGAERFANGSNGTHNAADVSVANMAKWVGVFYKDTSASKVKLFGEVDARTSDVEILRLNFGNTKDTNIVLYTQGPSGANQNADGGVRINVTLDITSDDSGWPGEMDDIQMAWGLAAANGSFDSLGDTRSTEEASELLWGNAALPLSIGTKDEDHRSAYGIVIKNPKSNGASDQLELSVPSDQVKANVVIEGTSTTVSSGGVSYVPAEVSPVTKLASEVSSASDYQLIVVGGPCANDLAAELFDVSCDGWSFQEGEAVLKLVDNGDKVALLVAGTTATDTRRAAKALAAWETYELSGTEMVVSGTSLSDISVAAAV
ncbi:MAG TPA: S-layer protein, partial [Candidatus Nanoarchaeia archaeon]|nr:S-layer protein [Candidatus Nanoarchaeia archaeon]